jgi:RNA polymerase sigma factor (sigma-70 family)
MSFLRNLVRPRGHGDTADAHFLDRFVTCRDEAAFAELVRRHGPMVLAVCRRVLHQEEDVEDAFQATFLVLVRKAASLRPDPKLGGWLYGVACRVAGKARVTAARRCAREARAPVRESEGPPDELLWRDLRPVLDEEVERLPKRLRAPFLLCYFQGKTNEEAARELGCPKGTVLSRLATARERLRARLARRGVTLSAAALLALLSERAGAAAVPAGLCAATAQLATGTDPAASASVTLLTEGVLRVMWMRKLRTAAAITLAVCAVAGGVGYWGRPNAAAQTAAKKVEERPVAAGQGADRIKGLLKARYEAASEETRARATEYEAGRGNLDILAGASLRLLEAERELNPKHDDQLAALRAHAKRMKDVYELADARYQAGRTSTADAKQAEYHHLDAELRLERWKSKNAPAVEGGRR